MKKTPDAADRLEEWRASQALTQVQLAKKLRVAQGTLSRWLSRERVPGLKDIGRIAKVTAGFVTVVDWMNVKRAKRAA